MVYYDTIIYNIALHIHVRIHKYIHMYTPIFVWHYYNSPEQILRVLFGDVMKSLGHFADIFLGGRGALWQICLGLFRDAFRLC